MTLGRALAVAAALLVAVATSGCAWPHTRVSGELAWSPESGSAAGSGLQEIAISPGEVVRFATDRPLEVVTVYRTAQGEAEVTTTLVPREGVLLVRPALGATALRVPRGIVAHTGAAKDPEIAWFDLESDALAWSRSPLGTPFPSLVAAPRLDAATFSDLDAALADGGRAANGDARAPSAITAVRALVALRALAVLEGVRPYPYARNGDVPPAPSSARTRDIKGRTFVEVVPGRSSTVSVDGPTRLAVWARAVRGTSDAIAGMTVREGGRTRGQARAVVRHLAAEDEQSRAAAARTPSADDAEPDPGLAPVRRILVHVPPGRHSYEIAITGTPIWVAATDTSAFRRLEGALSGADSERRLFDAALGACRAPVLAAPCALALALGGEDVGPRYASALASAPAPTQQLASRLASGEPADRAAKLESDAATGDGAALSALARDTAATIDGSLRDGWWRATVRATRWQPIDSASAPTWFAFLPPESAAGAACRAHPGAAPARDREREVDATETTALAVPWRRARAVRLLVVAPCGAAAGAGAPDPVQLEVDGQTLSAQPGSPRALWHVVVKGETAHVRRLDHGPGHVYLLSDDGCNGHGTLVRAATPLDQPRPLAFPAGIGAPGVEAWIKEGTAAAPFAVVSGDDHERLDVVARATGGLVAIDEHGARWERAATIPLPAWSSPGARAIGSSNVALRPVARGIKGELDVKPVGERARPADVEAVLAASRRLNEAKTADARAAAALERALVLASFGLERAALEDAELAKSFGGASTDDPVAKVRRAILAPERAPLALASPAYGIEADFDPRAKRCAASADGPRARIAALEASLKQRGKSASFDRSLAVEAATLASTAPQDPRAATLLSIASGHSKWRLLKEVEGGGGRVARPHEKDANAVVDAEGRLRARVQAGDPFGESFVSISSDRPARAFIADLGAAKARLDVVCVPRRAPLASERCPLDVRLGDAAVAARVPEDGRATIELPRSRGRGKGADLSISVAPSRGDFIAVVRIVLDAPVAGAKEVNGVGWVLETPHIQYRFVLPPGRPIRVRRATAGLLRIDAVAEPGETGDVIASEGGRDIPVPTSGQPTVVPVTTPGEVSIRARGGTFTVAIAERVESDLAAVESGDEASSGVSVRQDDLTSARVTADEGAWRERALASPKPLGWLQDRLGTVEALTGGVAGTLREGAVSDTALDAYAFESLAYRRRIESINLFTMASGLVRVRDAASTYGGGITLYEDLDALRLRITGTADVFTQRVEGTSEYTIRPRGFVEYSGRVASDFYVLPRVGYDGYHTTLSGRPPSTRDVDDDVYNAFRFQRNDFAFLQGLLWYVPFFNQIVYTRVRGTFDVTNGAFSHASIRPGTFLVFHALEMAAFVDGSYFERTAGARADSGVDLTGGAGVVIHLPVTPGSFEVRPNSNALVRADGGWQVFAGISIIASYRRGVRDYSSLELSFPEETSGGVPWRTEKQGP